VAQTYGRDSSIIFLFVNVKGDNHELAAEFLSQKGSGLSFVVDPNNKAIVDYGGNGLPTRVVIDRHGKVRFRNTGLLFEMGDQEQENELIAMLELIK